MGENCGCMGLVSGEWKHEEGGGDAGCFGVDLRNGMQEIGSWKGAGSAGCRSGGDSEFWKKEKGILALSGSLDSRSERWRRRRGRRRF